MTLIEMSSTRLYVRVGLCVPLSALGTAVSEASGPTIVGIAAQRDQLVLQLGGAAAAVRIVEPRPYQVYAPGRAEAVAWEGRSTRPALSRDHAASLGTP